MASRLADELADDFLAMAVAVHQLAEGGCLLDRIQILTLDILDKRDLGARFLIEFPN